MRTVVKPVLVSFIVLMLVTSSQLFAAHCATTAATYLPGVSPGQFIHYDFQGSWVEGNDTELENYTGTHSMFGTNVTVLSVANTSISYRMVIYNSTYTFINITQSTDVETHGYVSGQFFIAANLTAGDYVRATNNNTWINDTKLADYLGQQLETNHVSSAVNYTQAFFLDLNLEFSVLGFEDCYYHKQSGVLLEVEKNFNTSRMSGSDLFVGHIVSTLIATLSFPPVIQEYPAFFLVPLLTIATLPPVIALRRKRRTNTKV